MLQELIVHCHGSRRTAVLLTMTVLVCHTEEHEHQRMRLEVC